MRTVIMGMIRFYQLIISPLTPPTCRYHPTCSAYALEAIKKYGSVYGSWLAIKRFIRCGPWHPGGYDPLP